MPTGYTSDLYDGKDVSFADFVLQCARAAGAAVMLRDTDPRVVVTPENVTSDNYAERHLDEVEVELARYEKFDSNEWLSATEQYNEEIVRAREAAVAKNEQLRESYTNMIRQVDAWEPPTENHVEFKEFMLKQLQQSLDHDVDDDDPRRWYETCTVEQHREKTLARLRRDVEYYSNEAAKERERNEWRAEWVRELYKSLGVGAVQVARRGR